MPAGRKDYRDRLFNFIFGNEEHPEWTLSLYNAVNRSDYMDSSMIERTSAMAILYPSASALCGSCILRRSTSAFICSMMVIVSLFYQLLVQEQY